MRHLTTILAVLAVLTLPGCTAMLLGNNSSAEPATRSSGDASRSAADSAISGAIRQQYVADADISRFSVGIRTLAGRVTLTGTVGSYDVRDRVVDIARNTHGVVSVDSRVVVNTNL